jgi:hypothetical protein
MSFTNVAWESRDVARLARDLTEGPGPVSVGHAGAALVRIADELESISADYDKVVDKVKSAFVSQGGDAAARKLEEFGAWLAAMSLSAAGNGHSAEQAAVAFGVAVVAMPSVSEAVQTQTAHEVMASLAAYNGAILHGQFAELDEAATAHQATAAAVMYQYEDACSALAAPWDQPLPPDVCTRTALTAERDANTAGHEARTRGGGGGSVEMTPAAPVLLAPFQLSTVTSSGEAKQLRKVASDGAASGAAGIGPTGGGYGPLGTLARGGGAREHETSVLPGTLDGAGESGAGLSASDGAWLPAAQPNDAPFVVSDVSWAPSTSVFDDLAVPDKPETPGFADEPLPTLEQVSDRWVSPPVIGADKGLT